MSATMSHERAYELLPWLVNGTLAATERELVEQHLRSCLPCRRELKEQQRLRTALRAQAPVPISPQLGFEKLASAIGGAPVVARPLRRRIAPFARFATVGAAGVVLVGALYWLATTEHGDRYAPAFETLATQPAAQSATDIDVVFARSTTASEMQDLLAEIGGSIAAGPSELGRYTVRIDGAKDAAEIDALLERLQRDARVRYAGRALAAQEPR